MRMSKKGFALLTRFEGCELAAYQDPVGVWTIGYGWTKPVDGLPVAGEMVITQDVADRLLSSGIMQYEKEVAGLISVDVNQNQFDALVDFAYNLGPGALKSSTLLKKLNAGDLAGAADEFPKWNKAGGKVLRGLVERRAAERTLFLS
ncbi:Phage-related lysozyme (muraminidase) [Cedecea neteri]|uniref:Lysozyme n=1 Tax=Cedecea neteri TaxID=158822 RepID=A0A291DWS4_9ENTR|nr:lysozyme [Cedecea neteri]ATF92139.1 muraminidase [Cedecea neteri]SQC90980.1 Phage-related lysozyme (muraminidase) [Cedecea neteri]